MTIKTKKWALITLPERDDIEFLNQQKAAYELSVSDCQTDPDYIKIVNQIHKIETDENKKKQKEQAVKDKAKNDPQAMSNDEKVDIARTMLNHMFRKHIGPSGLRELVKIVDEDAKIVLPVKNQKAYTEQLADAIADVAMAQQIVLAPRFVRELAEFWLLYGEKIDKFETYGGFDDATWCVGRALIKPAQHESPTPTWDKYLSRMNDPHAFAAWIYGVASKRYRGRQTMWVHGQNGEDGKSYVMKRVIEWLFPNVAQPMTNSSLNDAASRFIGAEFEGKALAYWDDCNNQMALMREDVKQLSSGIEGNQFRIEHKGDKAYSAQLETRMWINSNYPPHIPDEHSILSRLLYIKIDPLLETPDVNIGEKFKKEFAAFLFYAKQSYERLCVDDRYIEQNSVANKQIEEMTEDFDLQYETILEQYFDINPVDSVDTSVVQAALKKEGIKHNIEQGRWYAWLKKKHNLERVKVYENNKQKKVIRGLSEKTIKGGKVHW